MIIEIKNGLIYHDKSVVDVCKADEIARANDCLYAERFVDKYKGNALEIDDSTMKIKGE